jgi:hypothetical protein
MKPRPFESGHPLDQIVRQIGFRSVFTPIASTPGRILQQGKAILVNKAAEID